jgi:hypothetical protein
VKAGVAVVMASVVAALAGVATAGSLARQPGTLVLRESDFPAGATYNTGTMPASFTKALAGLGVRASGAYFSVTIPKGASAKYQEVNGLVVTTASAGQAKTTFAAFKKDLLKNTTSVLGVPSYGDEQLALYHPTVGSKAELLVRRNTIVWQLEVAGGGLLVIPKPALMGELQKYAAKQKTRIGAG